MKSFRVPLPDEMFERVQAAEELRNARRDAIAAYAAQNAGTMFDLDTNLETAGIEQLGSTRRDSK